MMEQMKKNIILDRWKCERCDRGPCFYISASRPLICPFMVDHPILVGWRLQEGKMKEVKKLVEEEHPIEGTCPICGEKIELKSCQEIPLASINHLQQSHKVEYAELMVGIAKITKFFEMKKKEAKKLVEKPPIVVTCRICGEKLEAKTSEEILIVGMDHLRQFHKEVYDKKILDLGEIYKTQN